VRKPPFDPTLKLQVEEEGRHQPREKSKTTDLTQPNDQTLPVVIDTFPPRTLTHHLQFTSTPSPTRRCNHHLKLKADDLRIWVANE